jgi:hypothetical protein
MKRLSLALATLTLGANIVLPAQDPMVGGAKMYGTEDIVANAVIQRITPRWWQQSRPPVW